MALDYFDLEALRLQPDLRLFSAGGGRWQTGLRPKRAQQQSWLLAPMMKFGGGTNEIQRDIVAQRGLGLPRG